MKKVELLAIIIVVVGISLTSFIWFSNNSISQEIQSTSDSGCNIVKYKQGIFATSSGIYERDLNRGSFIAPWGLHYEDVKFNKLGTSATITTPGINFFLNGVDCGPYSRDEFALTDFTDTCLNALNEGMNFFNSTKGNSGSIIVHEIFIEMEYRPANCDK